MKLLNATYRPWVVYTALSLISLGIMTSNLQGGYVADLIESTALSIFSPIYKTVETLFNFAQKIWDDYFYLVDLQSENRNLKLIIQKLQEEQLAFQDNALSINRLESLIGASINAPVATISANVIRRSNALLNPIILIDRGSSDGIREGMGVATANGALGQIIYTTSGTSKVLTLHHVDAGIGAMLQSSRIQGVVSGTGKGISVMRFISRFDPIVLGEQVVTSGLDGAFPKGVPIGKVSAIKRDASEMFQTIEIVTHVNMNTIEEVIVFLMPESSNINLDISTDDDDNPNSINAEQSFSEKNP